MKFENNTPHCKEYECRGYVDAWDRESGYAIIFKCTCFRAEWLKIKNIDKDTNVERGVAVWDYAKHSSRYSLTKVPAAPRKEQLAF